MMEVITTTKVFLRNEDDILLLQRSNDDPLRAGQLDLPGGGVDDGEDIYQAAGREIYEETGLQVGRRALLLAYASTHIDEGRNLSLNRQFIMARAESRATQLSHEHQAGLWVPETELTEVMTHVPHLAAYWHIQRLDLWASYDQNHLSSQHSQQPVES